MNFFIQLIVTPLENLKLSRLYGSSDTVLSDVLDMSSIQAQPHIIDGSEAMKVQCGNIIDPKAKEQKMPSFGEHKCLLNTNNEDKNDNPPLQWNLCRNIYRL